MREVLTFSFTYLHDGTAFYVTVGLYLPIQAVTVVWLLVARAQDKRKLTQGVYRCTESKYEFVSTVKGRKITSEEIKSVPLCGVSSLTAAQKKADFSDAGHTHTTKPQPIVLLTEIKLRDPGCGKSVHLSRIATLLRLRISHVW